MASGSRSFSHKRVLYALCAILEKLQFELRRHLPGSGTSGFMLELYSACGLGTCEETSAEIVACSQEE